MSFRILVILLSLAALPATAGDWRPEESLEAAHDRDERLHEHWTPLAALDWQVPQRLALRLVCDFGLVALGLSQCEGLLAIDKPHALPKARDVLMLPEPGSGGGQPDFQDLRRRSIEERMQSI